MSKVKIEGNASGTGTLTISAPNTNTDRTLTLPDGAGEILLSNGDGSSLTGITTGKVLQVVEATPIYSVASTNQTTYQNVISTSITPSATTSKIMVYFQTSSFTSTTTGNNTSFTLFRDSTNTSSGNGDFVFRKDSDGTGHPSAVTIIKLDSPSTTSSVTYTVKFKQESTGGDSYYSYQGSGTFLTLMEIGA